MNDKIIKEAIYCFANQKEYAHNNIKVLIFVTDLGITSRLYISDRLVADRSNKECGSGIEVIITNSGHPNKHVMQLLNEVIKVYGAIMGTIYIINNKWMYNILDTTFSFPNDKFIIVS